MAKRFKKFFQKNTKNYSKNKQIKKSYPGYKKKDFSKEPPICYECKGMRYITENCGNKKQKYKPKVKAMATKWADEFETSEHESQSNEEAPSQEIKTFMDFGTPISSLLETSNSSSEDEGEYEEEEEIYNA